MQTLTSPGKVRHYVVKDMQTVFNTEIAIGIGTTATGF
jgi:hypothetical protein